MQKINLVFLALSLITSLAHADPRESFGRAGRIPGDLLRRPARPAIRFESSLRDKVKVPHFGGGTAFLAGQTEETCSDKMVLAGPAGASFPRLSSGDIAPRDRGVLDWDFGYSFADLLSFHQSEYVSALDVSFLGFRSSDLDEYSDRRTWEVIPGGRRSVPQLVRVLETLGGTCKESDMPSNSADTGGRCILNYLKTLENLQANAKAMSEVDQAALDQQCSEAAAHGFFSNLSAPEIKRQAGANSFRGAARFIDHLRNLNCTDANGVTTRKALLPGVLHSVGRVLQSLDEQITADRMVMAAVDRELVEPGKMGRRYVTVIGRHWDGERSRCQYLIRDSLGDDCHKPGVLREQPQCQGDGTFYVDAADLNTYLNEFYYFTARSAR